MRFLEVEDPIALAALEYVLERDAADVRKLLEWLPEARSVRDRRAILSRALDLMRELEHAIGRIAEVE
jgi:acyl-CoA reductase-like NAD-dependent aldehyde dehydrogenase